MKFTNSLEIGQVPTEEKPIRTSLFIDYFPAMKNEINLYTNMLKNMFPDFTLVSYTINAIKNSDNLLVYVLKINYNEDDYLSLSQFNFILKHLPKKWSDNNIYSCHSKYFNDYVYLNKEGLN